MRFKINFLIKDKIRDLIKDLRINKRHFFIYLTTFFLLFVLPLSVFAVLKGTNLLGRAQDEAKTDQASFQKKGPSKKEYVEGEVLVKFKPQVLGTTDSRVLGKSIMLDKQGKEINLDKQAEPIKIEQLDEKQPIVRELKEKKIETMEKVFKGAEEPQIELQKIKTKFAQEIAQGKRKIDEKAFLEIDLSRIYKFKFDPKISVEQKVVEFYRNPLVEYAEPNYIFYTQLVPNDPYYLDSYPDNTLSRDPNWNPPYDYQWNLKNINMGEAWDMTTGSEAVTVAVVDTGIDYTHLELKDNTWINKNEIASNSIDDDNNGFIDDVYGWDFYSNDNEPLDDDGHGTHVAGIIAAKTDNSLGIAGISWNVKVMAVRGLSGSGGASQDLSDAIVYAADNGVKVINMSWGSTPMQNISQVLKNALDYAFNLDIVLVAAAGNSRSDVANGYWPANYKHVISVGALDQQDAMSSYSNYGKVEVTAPGGSLPYDLLSLNAHDPQNPSAYLNLGSLPVGNGYLRLSGTSMASPHVAGLAGLILSKNSSLTNLQVKSLIELTADDIRQSGHDEFSGWGRINAGKALTYSSIPPVAEIHSPSRNENITNIYPIIGTATSTNFQNYTISVGVGKYPTSWTISGIALKNNGTVPVNNGELGTLDTSLYKSSVLTIRLTTFSSSGLSKERYVTVLADSGSVGIIPLAENVIVNDITRTALWASGGLDQLGNLYVAWADTRTDPANLRANIFGSKSTDQGKTFSSDFLISDGLDYDKFSFHSSVEVIDDSILVAYESYDTYPFQDGRMIIKKSVNNGNSFDIREVLTTPGMWSTKTAGKFMQVNTATYNNYLYLVWQAGNVADNKSHIHFARFNNNTNTVEVLKEIKIGEGFGERSPSIITDDNGRIYIVLSDKWNAYVRVALMKSFDKGDTFTVPNVIFPGTNYVHQGQPVLAIDKPNNILYVIWLGQTPTSPIMEVWVSKSADGGTTFSDPYNVTYGQWMNPFGALGDAMITVNSSGKVFISWMEVTDHSIQLTMSDDFLQSFYSKTLVSSPNPHGDNFKIDLIPTSLENIFILYDLYIPSMQSYNIMSRRTDFPLPSPTLTPTPTPTPTPTQPPIKTYECESTRDVNHCAWSQSGCLPNCNKLNQSSSGWSCTSDRSINQCVSPPGYPDAVLWRCCREIGVVPTPTPTPSTGKQYECLRPANNCAWSHSGCLPHCDTYGGSCTDDPAINQCMYEFPDGTKADKLWNCCREVTSTP